jgi:hypothetical protein
VRRRTRTERGRVKLAAAVVAHTERTRRHRDRRRFPLTAGHVQRTLRHLGTRVGEKQARAIRRAAVEYGIVEEAGHYLQHRNGEPTGARVKLYRRLVGGVTRTPSFSPGNTSPRRARVTRRNWWADPLMGEPDGRPPPRRVIRRSRSWGGAVTYAVWTT